MRPLIVLLNFGLAAGLASLPLAVSPAPHAPLEVPQESSFAGWLKDGSMLITTRRGNGTQLERVRAPLGGRELVPLGPGSVRDVAIRPAAGGDGFAFARQPDGTGPWQLFHHDFDSGKTTQLTHVTGGGAQGALWSPDGRQLAYSSTERNGVDSDLWLLDIETREHRLLVGEGGNWLAKGFSPDARQLLVMKQVSRGESFPGKVDLATGKLQMFPVDGGKAAFGAFVYAPDGKGSYYVSNEGAKHMTLRNHDVVNNSFREFGTGGDTDVNEFGLASDGRHLAYSEIQPEADRLHVLTLPAHQPLRVPPLPGGRIHELGFSPDGKRLAFTVYAPELPGEIYVLDIDNGDLIRWTIGDSGDRGDADD